MTAAAEPPLVTAENITQRFAPTLSIGERISVRFGSNVETRTVHAIDDVSLVIRKGEVLGLAGESGCGKSTLGRIIAGIQSPTAGRAQIAGATVMGMGKKPVKTTTRVQMVFQDPSRKDRWRMALRREPMLPTMPRAG